MEGYLTIKTRKPLQRRVGGGKKGEGTRGKVGVSKETGVTKARGDAKKGEGMLVSMKTGVTKAHVWQQWLK